MIRFNTFIKIIGFILWGVFICGHGSAKEILILGKTMGTTYHVKVVSRLLKDADGLKVKIDRQLEKINKSMSTFLEDSEISRFNSDQSGKPFEISNDFFSVIADAKKLYELTDSTWDGTVLPLVNLWGFGNSKWNRKVPHNDEVQNLLENTGFSQIKIINEKFIAKENPYVSLDFASIAKGYGVDLIAGIIKESGFENFIVEIGGEVYASGIKEDGSYWRVGVNLPDIKASVDQVYRIVNLKNEALATSGDYRNFFEIDGNRYSHVIDPRTGYPVKNGVVSVSILAESCMFADGLATAVMVMGHKKGLELVKKLKNTECLIIVREIDGRFKDYFSDVMFAE